MSFEFILIYFAPPERLDTVAAECSQRMLEDRTEKVSELERRLALSEAECERLQQVRACVDCAFNNSLPLKSLRSGTTMCVRPCCLATCLSLLVCGCSQRERMPRWV
jgi:hypothetical protein